MATHTVGKVEAPDLEEREYEVTIIEAKKVDSDFGDSRLLVNFGINEKGHVDDEGNALHWGEYLNISLGKRANLYKLLCIVFHDGDELPKGSLFDDDDCSLDGELMMGRPVTLNWRARMVEHPRTHDEQVKVGWDIAYTYDRVRIAKEKKTGKVSVNNAGEFMTRATDFFDKTPKQVRDALGVAAAKDIKDFDQAWETLKKAFSVPFAEKVGVEA